MVESFRIIDSQKYLWDGCTYEDENKAKEVEENYKKEGFETRLIEEGDQYLVYTRRVVSEIELDENASV